MLALSRLQLSFSFAMDPAGLDKMRQAIESLGARLGKHQEGLVATRQALADVTTRMQHL